MAAGRSYLAFVGACVRFLERLFAFVALAAANHFLVGRELHKIRNVPGTYIIFKRGELEAGLR